MSASLFFGSVMHERVTPVSNRFRYPVFFIQVPLGALEALRGPLFSIDRWNIFSLRLRDYGARDGSDLRSWMRELLTREGLGEVDGEITLQTFPRVLIAPDALNAAGHEVILAPAGKLEQSGNAAPLAAAIYTKEWGTRSAEVR